jgi:hypothetical protein
LVKYGLAEKMAREPSLFLIHSEPASLLKYSDGCCKTLIGKVPVRIQIVCPFLQYFCDVPESRTRLAMPANGRIANLAFDS